MAQHGCNSPQPSSTFATRLGNSTSRTGKPEVVKFNVRGHCQNGDKQGALYALASRDSICTRPAAKQDSLLHASCT
eukprot:4811080-Pleurochrysis_carterae.AAC.2